MKTLNEVIGSLEYCTGFDFVRCQDCPGYAEPDCGVQDDALHYLKAFRDAKDTLEREKDRYAEAVKNCERAENLYKQKQKAAEDALWKIASELNEPLSWDELKSMEGMPVWLEVYDPIDEKSGWHTASWKLIEFINDEYLDVRDSDGEQVCFYKSENDWRAYKKEKK